MPKDYACTCWSHRSFIAWWEWSQHSTQFPPSLPLATGQLHSLKGVVTSWGRERLWGQYAPLKADILEAIESQKPKEALEHLPILTGKGGEGLAHRLAELHTVVVVGAHIQHPELEQVLAVDGRDVFSRTQVELLHVPPQRPICGIPDTPNLHLDAGGQAQVPWAGVGKPLVCAL